MAAEKAAGVETCPICGTGTRQRPTWDCPLCGFPPDYVEGVSPGEVASMADPAATVHTERVAAQIEAALRYRTGKRQRNHLIAALRLLGVPDGK